MATNVIDKIAKLRRLAQSTNVNEAAAAAAAADRLMQEHGIAEAQLEAAGETPKESATEASDPLVFWAGNHVPSWQVNLAARLVDHYGCACCFDYKRREVALNQWQRGKVLQVFGRPSDVENVRYMYAWLVVEIEGLAQRNRGNGRAWINSFRLGAVRGVIDAMRAEKEKVRAEAMAETVKNAPFVPALPQSNISAAMVLIDNRAKEAKAVMNTLHPGLRAGRSSRGPSDGDGYGAGREAGARLGAQHKKLGAGGTRSLKA